MNKKKAVAQKTFDDKMRSFGRACYWGRASGPARRDARELRAYYKAALAEAERLRVDNEKLKAWRAGAGPMGTGRIGMGPPVLSDGRHPGPGKQRVHRSGEFSDATRILKCGLCRERHVFHVEGSADPGIALLNMTEDSGWADFPNRHGQGRCVCPDCRQRMNER